MIHNVSRRVVLAVMSAAGAGAISAALLRGYPRPGQELDPNLDPSREGGLRLDHKRKKNLLKHNLERMRKDASELAALAASIQEDLEKVTENELPLRLVNKAEQVEKIAKRIKNTAKGF